MKKRFSVNTIINVERKALMFHCLRMYRKIIVSCLETFGIGQYFFYYLFKIPVKLLYINISLFLDKIFFPAYRDVKIENPIFIIGHPRSATSFLHEILIQSGEFLAFKKWEFYNPSLTVRKILQRHKTLRNLFNFISDFRLTPHRIGWELKNKGRTKERNQDHKQKSKIGGEEELLFLNILDTQFLAVDTPIGFSKTGYPEICFNDEQPHQERSVLFLKDCLKRQIYYTGMKQIIAKMNFSIFRIKTLLKFFPDAKFIFLVRSPLETIRSHLSAQRTSLDRHYGLRNIPNDKLEQFFKNRYQYNILFYKRLAELMDGKEISKNQFIVIPYDSIKTDLKGSVEKVKSFTSIRFSSELDNRIKEQDKKQFSYKRKHKNLSLEAFNLTKEKIKSDFNFFFEKYG